MTAPLSLGLFLFESTEDRLTMLLAFGLSLTLFGLTTIESFPLSPQSPLSHEETLSSAYRMTLWLLSIQIVMVVPSLIGSSLGRSFGHYFCCIKTAMTSDDKRRPIFDYHRIPWSVRLAWKLGLGLILLILKRVVFDGFCFCFTGRFRRTKNGDASTLPLRDESMRRSPSADLHDDLSSIDSPAHQNTEGRYLNNRSSIFTLVGGILGILLTLLVLSTIGPLVVQPSSANDTTLLSLVVSWICALGLIISSVLNGFGSVSLPYTHLSGFFLQRVKPDCIAKVEKELRRMEDTLAKKRTMMKELKVEIPTLNPSRGTNRSSMSQSSSKTFSLSSFLPQNNSSSTFSELGDELRIRRGILHTEIRFMEDLVRETTLDLEELKHSQLTAAAARTSMGKTKSYVGIIFSIILLARLFNAGYSIFRSYGTLLNTDYAAAHHSHHHKKSRSDIITSILLWITGHRHSSTNQYNTISQMVSLLLSALLSFTQVRTFLRTANIVHRRLSGLYKKFFREDETAMGAESFTESSSDPRSSNGTVLWPIISAFLGCYSLACIVLIKMMLPEKFSVAFSLALKETGIFTIHSSIVNTVFFSSAVLSAATFGILLGIQRQNISKHTETISLTRGSVSSLPDV